MSLLLKGLPKKTQEFNERYEESLNEIVINGRVPKLKGSYKRSAWGDYVTDIDNNTLITFTEDTPNHIYKMLSDLRSNPTARFHFLYLGCGWYDEYIPPWEIDTKGGCRFNLTEARKWIDNLKESEISLPEVVSQAISKILHQPTMQIKDLIKIRSLIKPYGEITWDIDMIQQGWVENYGKKYQLYDLLHRYNGILEFAYHDINSTFVSVTTNLLDIKHQFSPFKEMWAYYTENYYSMLKSIKWKIYPDVRTTGLYKQAIDYVSIYVSASYQIELIENMIKYTFIDTLPIWEHVIFPVLQYIRTKVAIDIPLPVVSTKIPSKDILGYIDGQLKKIIDQQTKKIYPESKFFRYINKKNPQNRRDLELKLSRMYQSRIPVSADKLISEWDKGNVCPFFNMDIEDLESLSDLAQRTYIELSLIIRCFEAISQASSLSIKDTIKQCYTNNKLRMNSPPGHQSVKLYLGKTLVGTFPYSAKQKIQAFIITYGLEEKDDT